MVVSLAIVGTLMRTLQAHPWLAVDAMLLQFSKNKLMVSREFVPFIEQGKGVSPWGNISNQLFR